MRYISQQSLAPWRHHAMHRGQARHVGALTNDERKSSIGRTLGLIGTGGVLGVIHGRYAGMPTYRKVPLDAALFVAGKILHLMPGVPGAVARTAGVIGDASGVYFAGSLGVMIGQKARASAQGGQLTGQPPFNRPITQGIPTAYDARVHGRFQPEVLRAAVAGRA